jgi:16S rRNA G966 N2-methylase RsmD
VVGCTVLEPSAGEGALAVECIRQGALNVDAVEKDKRTFDTLSSHGLSAVLDSPSGGFESAHADFMSWPAGLVVYDRVVMNPPFARQQDLAHVTKAYSLVRSGGLLVAIMSAGVTFRGDRKTTAFRALVGRARGSIEELPAQSFRESGTDVHTVLVMMRKP